MSVTFHPVPHGHFYKKKSRNAMKLTSVCSIQNGSVFRWRLQILHSVIMLCKRYERFFKPLYLLLKNN